MTTSEVMFSPYNFLCSGEPFPYCATGAVFVRPCPRSWNFSFYYDKSYLGIKVLFIKKVFFIIFYLLISIILYNQCVTFIFKWGSRILAEICNSIYNFNYYYYSSRKYFFYINVLAPLWYYLRDLTSISFCLCLFFPEYHSISQLWLWLTSF